LIFKIIPNKVLILSKSKKGLKYPDSTAFCG